MSEDASFIPNGIPNAPIAEGMHGPEVAQRLQSLEEKNVMSSVSHPMANNVELKTESSKLPVASVASTAGPAPIEVVLTSDKPSLLGDPLRRDNRFAASADKLSLSKLPRYTLQQGGWLVEENSSRGNMSRAPGINSEMDTSDKMRGRQNSINHGTSTSVPAESPHDSQIKNEEVKLVGDISKQSLLPLTDLSIPYSRSLSTSKDVKSEASQLQSLSIGVLQEIGRRCKSKVEFRPVVSTSDDLQFSVEVYFSGEKIGVGMGKTRKDAQQQAAENALRGLADSYMSCVESRPAADNNFDRLVLEKEPGFIWEIEKPGSEEPLVSNGFPKQNAPEVGTSGNTNHG